ncbi:uncharacterized protein LOC107721117 [Sinocyclocheilus rhinocerous]|uniref:uncharacterized protein LOC107721117 n=1 Tax=Sinocyclocheilus rhinocerous TaxID=307959 RepID=UPI0007B939DA|nr:PREDICTED: uncharacterized protein LOC107721117 [Sinocyclocheilus rhinocerous]
MAACLEDEAERRAVRRAPYLRRTGRSVSLRTGWRQYAVRINKRFKHLQMLQMSCSHTPRFGHVWGSELLCRQAARWDLRHGPELQFQCVAHRRRKDRRSLRISSELETESAFIVIILIMSSADHTVMHGIWGSHAPAGNAMETPKNKGFSLIRMMSLNYRKEKNPQQQQHHNNMPFLIHCHIGKEIKHICSNCSRGSHAQHAEELENLASVHAETLVSGSHCRSRLASLGRLFKPWKWRKKQSETFKQRSTALERKMSVRQSREELIKRGVLKEIFERDSRITAVTPAGRMQNGLLSDCERTAEDRQSTAALDFRVSLDGGVCAQDNTLKSLTLPPKKTVTFPSDLQEPPAKPQLIHKQPPALPPKPFSRLTNHSTDT